jgi:hypothetical protein
LKTNIIDKEKIRENKDAFYWIPLMKHFYSPEMENDEDVIEGWYQYNMFFLPIVSKQWQDCVKPDNLKKRVSSWFLYRNLMKQSQDFF